MALDVWNFEFTFQTGRYMFIEQEITGGTEVQGCNWEWHNGEARSEIEDKNSPAVASIYSVMQEFKTTCVNYAFLQFQSYFT